MEEPITPPKETAVFEHFSTRRVKLPEVAFTGGTVFSWHFDEAVIEAEVVSDRVLPCWPSLSVVSKLAYNEVTDLTKCQHLVRRLGYGHGYQRYVGIRRLHVVLPALSSRDRGGFLPAPCFLFSGWFLSLVRLLLFIPCSTISRWLL